MNGAEFRVSSGRAARAALLAALAILPLGTPVAAAGIPATPVMTVYGFNGPPSVPYYDVDEFARRGAAAPAGTLALGSSVVPCLVIRGGRPLTDARGTPYVGIDVVVDARTATYDSTARFERIAAERKSLRVPNHHCGPGVKYVMDIRKIYALGKPPFFDPPRSRTMARSSQHGASARDQVVRAFHDSPRCAAANHGLMGRRSALDDAWDGFIRDSNGRWPEKTLAEARNLDYAMRTALYEGHLDRGCNAYGACERNVILLSIRNRARERCVRGQGCRYPGDLEGVSSSVSQYNIWDGFLTQISGLTACFLRADLASEPYYVRIRSMYEQTRPDAERILFGDDGDLALVSLGGDPSRLKSLRHYYHPPAMGKCFPGYERIAYISGAVARRGDDFALIANTRVRVDDRGDGGYRFREFLVDARDDRDVIQIADRYPGFVLDPRRVHVGGGGRCTPYGTPRSCSFSTVGRYRKVPGWLSSGSALQLSCRVHARGESCRSPVRLETIRVGGSCDTRMQPIAGVP